MWSPCGELNSGFLSENQVYWPLYDKVMGRRGGSRTHKSPVLRWVPIPFGYAPTARISYWCPGQDFGNPITVVIHLGHEQVAPGRLWSDEWRCGIGIGGRNHDQ